MFSYDKVEIRKRITPEQVYDFLEEWGAQPEYTEYGIVAETICHNPPGEGSKKLYYYFNSTLFQCYSNCGSFDIFQLVINIFEIQRNIELDLNDAVRYIAQRFNIAIELSADDEIYKQEDWKILTDYDRIQKVEHKDYHTELKKYDDIILSRFNYTAKITPWLKEDITQEVIEYANIGYFPGGAQITIPHYDKDNNFIGLRGRALCEREAEIYGKYRPIKIGKQLYNHPLGFNLYGLNWAKDNIAYMKKAIVAESEKAVLQYMSYFGIDNNICVASCGSNFTRYQAQLLFDLGVEEIIIAFDRQYQVIGDDEYKLWVEKLLKISYNYRNNCNISFIFDTTGLLGYKDSPLDKGKDIFLQLFMNRLDKDGKKYDN